jgi:hypothetical protein
MGGWSVSELAAAFAAAVLLALMTWAAHVRAAMHWRVARRGLPLGRALRHARRVHAAFGGLA